LPPPPCLDRIETCITHIYLCAVALFEVAAEITTEVAAHIIGRFRLRGIDGRFRRHGITAARKHVRQHAADDHTAGNTDGGLHGASHKTTALLRLPVRSTAVRRSPPGQGLARSAGSGYGATLCLGLLMRVRLPRSRTTTEQAAQKATALRTCRQFLFKGLYALLGLRQRLLLHNDRLRHVIGRRRLATNTIGNELIGFRLPWAGLLLGLLQSVKQTTNNASFFVVHS